MTIQAGDILFSRVGRPVLVTSRDPDTESVNLQEDISQVQKAARLGIKNGLQPDQRDLFERTRLSVISDDKRQEILSLRDRIKEMKDSGADPKVMRYLENELQHLVVREGITPGDYRINERTLIKG